MKKLRKKEISQIQGSLLSWGSSNRRDFVWRSRCDDSFLVLLSEMLLRKTLSSSAEPVVSKIIGFYPSPQSLLGAKSSDLEIWLKPLGLQHIRSEAILRMAVILCEKYDGAVPQDLEALMSIPHVGRYSANAVLCFAFGECRPIVDSNIARIFSRMFALDKPKEVHKAEDYWSLAEKLMPVDAPREYNWALLDLGAMLCKARSPFCENCPLNFTCEYGRKC